MTADFNKGTSQNLLPSARAFLFDFARFAGRRGVFAATFVALGALLEGVGLVLIVPLLGVVFGMGSAAGRLQSYASALFDLFGVSTALRQLALLLSLFGILMIARAVVISIRDVTLAELQIGFVEAQRLRVTEHLAGARWDQVARLHHARVTHLMSGDIQRVGIAAQFLLQGVSACVMLFVQCVLVFFLAPILACMTFALLIAGGIALVPVLRRARDLGELVTNANLTLLHGTTQFLGGLKLAVGQNLQSRFVTEFRETLHGLTHRQIDYIRQQTNGRLALTTLSALVGAALVFIGFGTFQTAPAVLVTLLLIIARMSGPAGQVQQGAQQFAHALPAYEKVKQLEAEFLSAPYNVEPSPGKSPPLDGPIVFEAVTFVYDDVGPESSAQGGVHQLSFVIKPGEFVGIGGPSGSGKTTLADLLVGLFPPQSGSISIGGKLLDDSVLAQWRAMISYVSQDPFLFHETIRRNLSWTSPQATESDLWEALHVAGADTLVRRMEFGLDTVVGERGTLVSGGERQRIALARAILRRPTLLVLDEATSAIDIPGERLIVDQLLNISPRPTIVMIAHRSESLGHCDRVLWLENGRFQTAVSDRLQ